jgi:hypothetical protein
VHVVDKEKDVEGAQGGDVVIEVEDVVIALSVGRLTQGRVRGITISLNQTTKAL